MNIVGIKQEIALFSLVKGVIKPPIVDVETLWSNYRQQFEAVAACN